jgi:hypothetical protein
MIRIIDHKKPQIGEVLNIFRKARTSNKWCRVKWFNGEVGTLYLTEKRRVFNGVARYEILTSEG